MMPTLQQKAVQVKTKWSDLSMAWKALILVASGIVTLGAAFATIGGGLETVDKAITTEEEHTADVVTILEQLKLQNAAIVEQGVRIEKAIENEDRREINDRIQRNNREITRLRSQFRNETDPLERGNIQADIDTYLEEIECIKDGTC